MNQETDKLLLVVEDEPHFQEAINIYLKEIGFLNVLLASNIEAALSLFKAHHPNIALINVEIGMDEMAGIHLAASFNALRKIPIIFITSNYNSAIYEEAKKVNPIAFINKEISVLKLKQVIELGLINSKKTPKNPTPIQEDSFHEEIFVKIGNVLKKFFLADISWFGVDGKYAYAQSDGKRFPLSLSLKDLEEKLGQRDFLRIHQSYMVNIRKIESVNPVKNTLIVEGKELPLGRSFKKRLLNRIRYF